MSVRADAESLRLVPIFRNCEAVPLQVLAFAAERQQFEPNEVMVAENQKAQAAFFVLQGTATVKRNKELVGKAGPGSLLGETAMLGGATYAVTATADGPVVAVRIERALFQRVATEYPEFGQSVLNAVSEKLDQSVRELDGVRVMLTKARSFSGL